MELRDIPLQKATGNNEESDGQEQIKTQTNLDHARKGLVFANYQKLLQLEKMRPLKVPICFIKTIIIIIVIFWRVIKYIGIHKYGDRV